MQATISTLLKQFFCGILGLLIEEKEAASSTPGLRGLLFTSTLDTTDRNFILKPKPFNSESHLVPVCCGPKLFLFGKKLQLLGGLVRILVHPPDIAPGGSRDESF